MSDLISRQAVKKWVAKWEGYIDADIIARMQYRVIDIPSAQPEKAQLSREDTTFDCIRRQEAIQVLDNAAEHWNIAEPYHEGIKAGFRNSARLIMSLPAAHPKFPENWWKTDHGYMWLCPHCGLPVHSDFEECLRCGIKRPSAQPERKKGQWIEVEVFPESYDIEGVKTWSSEMQCDQCGFRHTAIEGHMSQYNYCPNCGADMRGE